MDTKPTEEPEVKPKPRSHAKKKEKKTIDLNIPEKLFILSIDDDQGVVSASVKTKLRYGLAGALLAELALAKKIQLEEDHLTLADPTPPGDVLLDDILVMVAAEKKLHKLSHWVRVIGNKQTIKRVAERLEERHIITIEKKRYSWITPYIFYPMEDASAKYWVKQHLRGIILAGEKGETSDVALLSLLKACQLLRLVFTHDERKSASKKVDVLVQGEIFGDAVEKLLSNIEAAAAVATSEASG